VSLGVLGGTFDPIHLGHLRAAEAAREALGLERVLFVPAAEPPHRPAPAAAGLDRFAMVALATAPHPAFVASDLELRREGPSYSVDTLEELAARSPERPLVLILGSDAMADLPGWRRAERVLELARIAVLERPGDTSPREPPGWRLERVEAPLLEVSSSDVRRRLSSGLSVRYLVPDAVADYIAKRELYK
jgi:nicotinate-nucleotide adenylyltransferase